MNRALTGVINHKTLFAINNQSIKSHVPKETKNLKNAGNMRAPVSCSERQYFKPINRLVNVLNIYG